MTTARRERHDRVSAYLSARNDLELAKLIRSGRDTGVGVGGGSTVVEVVGGPVFVKRIPLTERERSAPRSTANLFDLPVSCQYGVGSPGFSAWRELAANQIVTDGVLAGVTEQFPLLHHWRVLPGRPPTAAEHTDIDAVTSAFGGFPAVRVRLEALATASYSLVLFGEYVPHPLLRWLCEDPASKAAVVERQLADIVAFLRGRELLHMDGHFGNLRTDGHRIYLTDFGLATSPRFDLSPAERDFIRHNSTHDERYAAMRLVNWLVTTVCGVEVPAGEAPAERNACVSRCAAGDIPQGLPPTVAAILARHAPAAERMNAFYWELFRGDVHAVYPG